MESKYWAFISYSHKDTAEAKWLHRSIERWRLPSATRTQIRERFGDTRRIFPVFRDRDELPSSAKLGQNLLEALDSSRTLIVTCSPHSAQSHWVNEEVLHFKRTGREDRIFPVIIDGQPNASDGENPELECFCPALRHPLNADGTLDQSSRVEPLAADLRPEPVGDGRRNSVLKAIAGILEVPFDSLKQRDKIRRRRQRLFAATLVAFVLAMTGLAIYQTKEQEVADGQRLAGQLLSMADAHYRKFEFKEGSEFLEESLAAQKKVGIPPSTDQLSLIYRTLLSIPGQRRADGVGQKTYLKHLANESLLIPHEYGSHTPVIRADDFSVMSYIDLTPVVDYLYTLGFTDKDISYFQGGLEADPIEGLLYVTAHDRLFVFDLQSGDPIEVKDIASILTAAGVPKDEIVISSVYLLGKKLILELGSQRRWIAVEQQNGSWNVIQDRNVVDLDSSTGRFYANSDHIVERYLGGELEGGYVIKDEEILDITKRGLFLSLAKTSEDKESIVEVLNANSFGVEWRCSVVEGEIIQVDPIRSDTLLVLTKIPNNLSLFRRQEGGCQLLDSYPVTGKSYFNYASQTNMVALPGLKGRSNSELFNLNDDEIISLASSHYPMAELTLNGNWYAVYDDSIIELFSRERFHVDTIRGEYLPSGSNTSILIGSGSNIRVLTPEPSIERGNIIVGPKGRNSFMVVDERGVIIRQFYPVFDQETTEKIVETAAEGLNSIHINKNEVRKLVKYNLNNFGLFYFTPIVDRPYQGYMYGRTFGALSRFELEEGRAEWLPVPSGIHKLNDKTGKVWTQPFTKNTEITVYDIEKGRAEPVEGSLAFFSYDVVDNPWGHLKGVTSGVVFSKDGNRTLIYDVIGRWVIVENQYLDVTKHAPLRSLRLTLVEAESSGHWLAATQENKLVRLSADGRAIQNQAPLRLGVEKIASYPELGLIVVGASDGVTLHDIDTLREIALIPGSGFFHASSTKEELLLVSENPDFLHSGKWNVYRLPGFDVGLVKKLDELRLNPPTDTAKFVENSLPLVSKQKR